MKHITKAVAFALAKAEIEDVDRTCLKTFIGPPSKESFQTYAHMDEASAMKAVKQYRVYFERSGMLENEVYDGIRELLEEQQKAGRKLFVATSKPEVYAKQILQHFDLDTYFTGICGSEMDHTRTSKGEVIAYALSSYGLDPQDCVMIGDRCHDLIGAKQQGMDAIGVLYGYGDKAELQKAGADKIVETIDALRELLRP